MFIKKKLPLIFFSFCFLLNSTCISRESNIPETDSFESNPSASSPQWDNTEGLMNLMNSLSDIDANLLREKIKQTPDTLITSNRTFYVSNKGRDSNNGISPNQAWATLDKVNNHRFRAGDVVLFERNGIFRGQLLASSNVSYGAYGKGSKPCIYGSVINYVNVNWTNIHGNIWVCQRQIQSDAGIIVFNHGENVGIKKLSMDSLTENFDFYYNPDDKLVYLLFSGKSPSSVFHSIEMGERKIIISIPNNGSNIIIENLCIKYGGVHGIYGDGTKNITIRGCELGWIGGSIQNGDIRYGNAIEAWNNVDNLLVEYCYIYQIYDAALTHQGTLSVTNNNVFFINNLVEYCNYSIEYFQRSENSFMSNIVYEGNIMRFAGYGWGQQRPDKGESSHIKSWGHYNKAENFIIRNNIMDTSRYEIFCIISKSGDQYLPFVNGNTFIQYENGDAGRWGSRSLNFENEDNKQIISMDANSTIILYKSDLGSLN